MNNKILVVGATGTVASNLVKLLAEKGEKVKAATRSPENYPVQSGVEATLFDCYKSDTWEAALKDVDRVYLFAMNEDPAPDKTLGPFIDKAKEMGVAHIVLLTAMGTEQYEDDWGLHRLEKHLMASGVAYTMLRPNWFMQNFIDPSIRELGGIYLPAEDAKSGFVDARDIAAVAATAFTEEGHKGQGYALTGSQLLDHAEVAAIISKVAGREITYTNISDDKYRQIMEEEGWPPGTIEMVLGLYYSVRQGDWAALAEDVSKVLGRKPITFEQFVSDHIDTWK